MFMPIFKLVPLIIFAAILSSCNKYNDDDLVNAENSASEQAALDGKIECALAGSNDFTRNCSTEKIDGQEGQVLVIRHPDGGFRRFNILTDGRGLAPAQGFDETKISIMADGMIEVSSGDDRYRLPAQIKSTSQSETNKEAKNAG